MRMDVLFLIAFVVILGLTIEGSTEDKLVITENSVGERPYRILLISNEGCSACDRIKQEIRTKLAVKGWDTYIEQVNYESSNDAKRYATQRGGFITFPQVAVVSKSDNSLRATLYGYYEGEELGWALYGLVTSKTLNNKE